MFKKIILAALIVTSAAFADFFSVGARAAANFGTSWGDDADDATWGVGFNAGVALKIDILPVIRLSLDWMLIIAELVEKKTHPQKIIKYLQKKL